MGVNDALEPATALFEESFIHSVNKLLSSCYLICTNLPILTAYLYKSQTTITVSLIRVFQLSTGPPSILFKKKKKLLEFSLN